MVIGVVTASLSLPEAQSPKEKRSLVRSLTERALGEMNVSVAEIGMQDSPQACELAFVTVAANSEIVQARISNISRFLRRNPRYLLIRLRTEML